MKSILHSLILVVMALLAGKVVLAQPPPPPFIHVSEIMYNSPEQVDSLNFIELRTSGSPTNLNMFEFVSGFNFTFPDSSVSSGSKILITQDSMAFQAAYGILAFQSSELSDLNLTDTIVISIYGYHIDSVYFDTETPWPNYADGNGYSLTRCQESGAYGFLPTETEAGIELNGLSVFSNPGEHTWEPCNIVGIDSNTGIGESDPTVKLVDGSLQIGYNSQLILQLYDLTGKAVLTEQL